MEQFVSASQQMQGGRKEGGVAGLRCLVKGHWNKEVKYAALARTPQRGKSAK